MTVPVLQVENLNVDYRLERQWLNALRDVSLTINPLEIHGLVGESGSGKTTLALALMRYLAPNARISSGTISLDGDDLLAKSPADMRRIWGKDISLVPQDSLASLNPSYPVGDQIAEVTRRHQRLSRRESWRQAVEMLRRVKLADPETVARRYPHQLSGGMQQRVTIAMALSTQPRLLILDEPTTALDVTTQAVILDLFRELIRANNAAALYVSHDLGIVAQLCDRVTVLYGGEVMASGPVATLYRQPLHPYTIGLLASLPRPTPGVETRLPAIEGAAPSLAERPRACVFEPRCPAAIPLCAEVKPALEKLPDGRLVKCHRWREIASGAVQLPTAPVQQTTSAPPRQRTVLQADGVTKRFGESNLLDQILGRASKPVRAVDGVSLRIRERSTLGLVGESGSGKTTLARCIVGLTTADEGELELLEVPLANALSQRSRDELRNLQMVFQNPNDALNPYHTVGQALARTIRRLSAERLTDEDIRQRIAQLLAAVRLPAEYAGRYPAELSGGEKQRVAIARAFAANPALIVADEPTSALDVSVQSVVLNLLKDLRARESASYLLISHNLDVVAYLADWIAVMYLGEIVEEGDADDVYNPPSHPYTEALVSARPVPDPAARQKIIRLEGEVPSARHLPSGCRFHTRCPRKLGAICETEAPPWRDAGDGHFIRCHIPVDELAELQAGPPDSKHEDR
nr:MAG: peptide ABC transporter ATP-binding protein [Chloroflexota bacterium]